MKKLNTTHWSRFNLLLLIAVACIVSRSLAQTTPADHSSSGAARTVTSERTDRLRSGVTPNAHSESSGSELPTASSDALVGSNAQDYVICDNDVLELYVLDVAELSRVYRVAQNGTVNIPLLARPIHASGITLRQFASSVESELRTAGLVSNPHVLVSVKESPVHAVAITGAVRKPQAYPLFARTTLLDVLSEAGGVAENAGAIALITRSASAAPETGGHTGEAHANPRIITVDLKQLLESGDPSLNLPIFPGDTITVPPGGVVYVVGAVNKPGGFVLSTEQENMTVMQALALAEDTKPTAARDKSMIVRRGAVRGPKPAASSVPDGQQIPIKLSQIMAGKAPDLRLQANDILFIPDSGSKKALHRGAEAAIQIATGMAIWGRP